MGLIASALAAQITNLRCILPLSPVACTGYFQARDVARDLEFEETTAEAPAEVF